MLEAIKTHNQLNGTRFSTVEFLVVFLAAFFIGAAYLARGSALGALLAGGVAINSLWIVGFGLRSWRRGEMGSGMGRLFNREYRQRVSREHPTLARQTALITVGTLIPFALTVLVLIDLMRSGR
jgi:hypothetical protein